MNTKLTLAQRILLARHDARATQDDIAEVCKTTRQKVGKWERGKDIPNLIQALKLAHYTDRSLDFFIEDLPIDLSDKVKRPSRCISDGQLDLYPEPPQMADIRAGGVLWELSDRSSVATSQNDASEARSQDEQLVA